MSGGDQSQEYVKLFFQTTDPVKTIETEALQTRLRTYFTQFGQRIGVPGNEAARQEAHSSALAMQHSLDDLAIILMSTNAVVQAGRVDPESARPGQVHPAWKKFCS